MLVVSDAAVPQELPADAVELTAGPEPNFAAWLSEEEGTGLTDDEASEMGRALIGDAYDGLFEDPGEPHELEFALTAAGLPIEDPIPHLKRRLGESMHSGHVREVMGRVMHFADKLKKIAKPLQSIPKQKQFGSVEELKAAYRHLDAPLKEFYASAKRLHLLDINVEQQEVEADSAELGDSENSRWGRRRTKKKSAESQGAKKKNSMWGRRRTKKKSTKATRRRRMTALSIIQNKLNRVLKKGKKGLGLVFKLLKMCTVKFLQMLGRMVKGFVSKIAKMFTMIPGMDKFAKLVHDCSNSVHDEARIKCSAGGLGPPGKHGYRTCKNGGGRGQNWLWTERINTRRPADEWLNSLPDSSECHDQKGATPGGSPSKTAALAKAKACFGPHMAPGAHGTKSATLYSEAQDNMSPKYRGPPGKFAGDKWVPGTIHDAPQNEKGFVYCADRYFNANNGGGHSYGSYKTKQEKQFWREFNYDKYRQACEYDNRCIFYNLHNYGNHQGQFRCVPRIHAEDPRFAHVSGYKQRSSKPHTDGRTYTKGKILSAQTAAAKWQRPAQPYLGGLNMKKQWIAPAKGDDENNARAHKLMGDVCIHYGWNSKFEEEKEGYLPPTAVRCLSQQFRVFTDEATFGVCIDFSPSKVGKLISDMMLRPILKMMPGGLERYLGPAFYDMVGKFAGKKLMIALQSLPYFMGFVFRSILYLFGDFYGIQWANIIGGFHPEANVEKQMGALDMSHDASQDRMDRVYRGKSECKSSVTTGCPTAIPVRAGYVYGERSGDVTGSAYDTLYAGRQHLKVHTATVQPAYIKHAVCLKVPLCDTTLAEKRKGDMYSATSGSLDCAGHGTCMWNMQKGNHCKCDRGYSFAEACMRCCTKGTSKEACCRASRKAHEKASVSETSAKKQAKKIITTAKKSAKKIVNDAVGKAKKAAAAAKKANAKVAAAVAKQKKAADAKALERAKKKASAASYKIPGPVTNYLKKLVKKQVRQGFAAAHGPIKGGSSQRRDDETLGEVNTLGMTDEEALLPAFKADQQKKGAGVALYGHQLVSKRCAGLNKQSCKNKLGCNWSLVPGDEDLPKADPSTSREKCVDAASWRCGVKKNFVDCVQHNKYGPSYVNWKFDSLCSGVMFDEKPKKRKLCSKGIRKRETCESNKDCPIFTGGGHAECKEYSAVAGCQVQAQQRCSAMGYQHVMQQV